MSDIKMKTTQSQEEVNKQADEEGTNVDNDKDDEKQATTWPRENSRTKSIVIVSLVFLIISNLKFIHQNELCL